MDHMSNEQAIAAEIRSAVSTLQRAVRKANREDIEVDLRIHRCETIGAKPTQEIEVVISKTTKL